MANDQPDGREELVRVLVATGGEDRQAFRRLYALTSAKLFGICLRICGERQAAEDVLQEVYVTIWKRAGAYEPGRASPIAWLAAIARNRAIDRRRAGARHPYAPLADMPEPIDQSPLASDAMLLDEEARKLHGCLDRLADAQRDAIRTAFFDGLTYAELAAAELALGVLDGEERAAALRRVLADPAFAREVERWRHHFAALYAEVPAVDPGSALERRVAAIPDGGGRSAGPWRLVAAVAGIAAAILLTVDLLRPAPRVVPVPSVAPPAALLAAVLTPPHAAPVAAVFDPRTREVRLRGDLAVAHDRDAELWAIGADGVPHAAGLLTARRGGPLIVGHGVAIAAGTTLAVSIEPTGGSPKPVPTGPVIATGTLAVI